MHEVIRWTGLGLLATSAGIVVLLLASKLKSPQVPILSLGIRATAITWFAVFPVLAVLFWAVEFFLGDPEPKNHAFIVLAAVLALPFCSLFVVEHLFARARKQVGERDGGTVVSSVARHCGAMVLIGLVGVPALLGLVVALIFIATRALNQPFYMG